MVNKYLLYNGFLKKKDLVEKSEYDLKIEEFKLKGFNQVFSNSFGGAEFCTLKNESETVNISYKEKSKTLRIITENRINLPFNYGKECGYDTLITQMQTTFFSYDCGMCYIIRIGDGSFVVIDGGIAEYDETKHFIEILNSQNIKNGLPVIRAWFITHPHFDHYGLFVEMIKNYSEKFILENLIYNWPSEKFASGHSVSVSDFNCIVKNLNGVNVITGRTGYKFELGSNVFEIIYSADDAVPEKFNNVNDTSLVIMQTVNNRKILYLADIMKGAANIIKNEYYDVALKAEIMQVAHHGFWGATNELYSIINPETLLWPLPDFWYYKMTEIEQNQFLMNSKKIKMVFFSSREEITLNMSEETLESNSHIKTKNTDIIFNADFEEKSILKLNWCCITGGATGYAAAKASFVDNGIRLVCDKDKMVVLEIVKPPLMEGVGSYTISINAEIKNCEKFGIFCNYNNPVEYAEDEVLDFEKVRGNVEYKIVADESKKLLSVFKNDKFISSKVYMPVERHGVYLIMKKSDIILKKVSVKK